MAKSTKTNGEETRKALQEVQRDVEKIKDKGKFICLIIIIATPIIALGIATAGLIVAILSLIKEWVIPGK